MNGDPVKSCPKCGHVRSATETAPEWQCPACGIAYHKFDKARERLRVLTTPARGDEPAPAFVWDGSVWSLVLANAFAATLSVYEGWSPLLLFLLYWFQCLVIGFTSVCRILMLGRFSTELFSFDGKETPPTRAVRNRAAKFFALHYAGLLLAFLFVIGWLEGFAKMVTRREIEDPDLSFWVSVAVFAANHLWSLYYNVAADLRRPPHLGTLVTFPYLRIAPMLGMVVFGVLVVSSTAMLLLFIVLKSATDVWLHVLEHRYFRKPIRVDLSQEKVTIGTKDGFS
jgi:hypothetical protein